MQVSNGPALLIEPHQTIVVEPGWRADVTKRRARWCSRATRRAQQRAPSTEADPVLLEVFANLFMAIAEEMGATLQNTASSVNIKERLDFSCAIFDAEGRAGRQRAAHAGASGLDGRLRHRDHAQASRRCATATCSSPMRLMTAARTCRMSRWWRRCSSMASGASLSRAAVIMPISAASRRARCRPSRAIFREEGVLFDGVPMVRAGSFPARARSSAA